MAEQSSSYVYIWEFIVKTDSQAVFEKEYGADGSWVQLFRNGDGYLGTELYHDRETSHRYLTIDHWTSKEAYESFRARYSEEFEKLDYRFSSLTEKETFLGSFFT